MALLCFLHGMHHEAQKSIKIYFDLISFSDICFPSLLGSVKLSIVSDTSFVFKSHSNFILPGSASLLFLTSGSMVLNMSKSDSAIKGLMLKANTLEYDCLLLEI